MSYDAPKANAKVLAIMANATREATPVVTHQLCGCVVTTRFGHIHTKYCKTHGGLTQEERAKMMTETEASGTVPIEPEQLLKQEKAAVDKPKKAAKKKPEKAAKPAKAAKLAKVKAKPVKEPKLPKEVKRKEAGDGLGREGTVTRSICERLVAGDTNEQAVAVARKKHKDRKIADNYGAWYRNDLTKRGLLKAAK